MPSRSGLSGTAGEQAGGKVEPNERACSWRHARLSPGKGMRQPVCRPGDAVGGAAMLCLRPTRTILRLPVMVLGMDFDLLQGQRGQGWCHTDTSYGK